MNEASKWSGDERSGAGGEDGSEWDDRWDDWMKVLRRAYIRDHHVKVRELGE